MAAREKPPAEDDPVPDEELRWTPCGEPPVGAERFASGALRIARRVCSSSIEAEDLAQEALVRLLHRGRSVADPWAWMRVVIPRLAARIYRTEVARRALERSFSAEREAANDPRQRLVDHHTAEAVLNCLEPRKRLLIRLWLGGASHAEIADRLGSQLHQVGPAIRAVLRSAAVRRLLSRQAAVPEL